MKRVTEVRSPCRGQTITAKKTDEIDEFTPNNKGIHQR